MARTGRTGQAEIGSQEGTWSESGVVGPLRLSYHLLLLRKHVLAGSWEWEENQDSSEPGHFSV